MIRKVLCSETRNEYPCSYPLVILSLSLAPCATIFLWTYKSHIKVEREPEQLLANPNVQVAANLGRDAHHSRAQKNKPGGGCWQGACG